MPLFVVEAMGFTQVETRFNRMGAAALTARPAMIKVTQYMMDAILATFQSEGRRGGGSWKQITQSWLNYKLRHRMDPRIGRATHALERSMTQWHAPNQRLEITNTRASIESTLEYAATAQRHRPFVKFTPRDRIRIRNLIRKHLTDAWNAPIEARIGKF